VNYCGKSGIAFSPLSPGKKPISNPNRTIGEETHASKKPQGTFCDASK
jgi:hypothetical protein